MLTLDPDVSEAFSGPNLQTIQTPNSETATAPQPVMYGASRTRLVVCGGHFLFAVVETYLLCLNECKDYKGVHDVQQPPCHWGRTGSSLGDAAAVQ